MKENLRGNRCISGVEYGRDRSLRYTRYEIASLGVKVYISDETRDVGLTFKSLKEMAISEMERVRRDPRGETTIDPFAHEKLGFRRSINSLKNEIQARINLPIAVKSIEKPYSWERYMSYEDLLDQFDFMRGLRLLAQHKLTGEQKEIIDVLPVYAAVRVGNMDYLFMKNIRGSRQAEDIILGEEKVTVWGFREGGVRRIHGFSIHKHPKLAEALGVIGMGNLVKWRDAADNLEKILGVELNDFEGRNVLCHREYGKRKYTIIDQRRGAFLSLR